MNLEWRSSGAEDAWTGKNMCDVPIEVNHCMKLKALRGILTVTVVRAFVCALLIVSGNVGTVRDGIR